jgi:hypothetical protein
MSIRKSTWKDKDVKEVSDTAVLHYLVVVFHKLCGAATSHVLTAVHVLSGFGIR